MKMRKHSRGMSLLITLAFIVIITILVVGFAETVRLSRPAAASFLERTRADQFARSGVERVIGVLNQQTGDTNRNWISQPGLLLVGSDVDDTSTPVDERKVLSVTVPLFSGSAPTSSPSNTIYSPVNINVATYRDPTSRLVTDRLNTNGNVIEMPLCWVYVRDSGKIDTDITPVVSTNDPIVGRYAFWTDDESSKVNYNIAWGKSGNTNAPGHPSRIELSALTDFTQARADILRNFVVQNPTNYNFLNTPFDARRIEATVSGSNSGLAAVLEQNKFEITHFNSDPNTTFFNEPRIVLTTRPDRAGWSYSGGQWLGVNGLPWPNGRPFYLRVLKNEGTSASPNTLSGMGGVGADPGRLNSIDAGKVSETINILALASAPQPSYMQRSDWPIVSGSASIQDKYYSTYPPPVRGSRLAELAINIIDYVRAKESSQDMVEPIRGQFSATAAAPDKLIEFVDSASNSYMGISRTPYISEIGVWTGSATTVAPMPSDSSYLAQAQLGDIIYKVKFEIHLPANYGIHEVDVSKLFVLFGATGAHYINNQGYVAFKLDAPGALDNPSNPGSSILKAGTYAVYTHVQPVSSGTLNVVAKTYPSGRPTQLNSFRMALSLLKGSANLDIAPLAQGGTVQINNIRIDPEATAENAISSIESDDPRVNKQRGDWIARANGNSFGAVNGRYSVGHPASSVLPALASGDPQRDTDLNNNISDASLYMPPPAGKTFTRADGTVDDNSRGQVMSVGELGFIHTGIEGCLIVRLGGVSYTVPPGVPWRTLRLQPNQANVSVVPDWALVDLFTAPVAAPNEFNKYVYAPHNTSFGGRVNLNSKAVPYDLARVAPLTAVLQNSTYDTTDQTKKLTGAEASVLARNVFDRVLAVGGKQYGYAGGYDSVGEVVEIQGIADGGEKSEDLFRQAANLLSTRGNVFSVYSVGQALKQSPGGKLSVLAEQRVQAMVERYADSAGLVHFAPVYFRNLTP